MSYCNAISRDTFTKHLKAVVTDHKVERVRHKVYRIKGLKAPDNGIWNTTLTNREQGAADAAKRQALVRGGR